jgi:hypothetical protein
MAADIRRDNILGSVYAIRRRTMPIISSGARPADEWIVYRDLALVFGHEAAMTGPQFEIRIHGAPRR